MATSAKEVVKESLGSITVSDKVNVLIEDPKTKAYLSKKAANDNNFNDLYEICEIPIFLRINIVSTTMII